MSLEVVKVKSISKQIRGVSYTPNDVSLVPIDNYIRLLRANNITENGIDLTDTVYVNKKCISEVQKLKVGDILIAASSGSIKIVGKAILIENEINSSFGAFCKVIRPNEKVDYRYLSFYFRSSDYRQKISHLAAGANINNLRNEDLDNLEITLPPLATQKRIAEILDAADAVRRKDQELLKKYDELAQAIFIDMFGDPVKNEKGWDVTSISGIFDVISGGTPSTKNPEYWENGDIPWIGSSLCKDNFVFKSNGKFITSKGLENSSAKMIPKNTVIIALVGATIGKIGLIKFETCTNQNVAALIPKNKETISEIFTFYMMKSLYHKFEEVGGDKFKMANLAFVKSLPFLSPPINLQIEFSEIITQIINLKKSTENGLGDDLFNTCIQKAFKGELVS